MRFFAIFALIAIVEMATFFWVESWIGLGWALLLALATAFIGSYLVKKAGLRVLAQMRQKMNQAQVPGRELSHGAAILVAGAFLISPGFITDALGFLLLLPAVREMIHSVASKRLTSRVTVMTANFQTPPRDTIQGEIIDVDPNDVD